MTQVTHLKKLAIASFIGSTLLLAGCGESSTSNETSQEMGQLQVMIRDAADDFFTYAVDVKQIELTRQDGFVVNVLPNQPRVDFVEYQTLSEFFTAQSVQVGQYTQIKLTLDFTDSEIIVADGEGNPVAAAPVDASGNPLAQQSITVELTEQESLNVRRGNASAITIDFDLAASNTIINDESGAIKVEVNPVLIASSSIDGDRSHRIRGLINEVTESSISIAIKPFRFKQGRFGETTLSISSDTLFDINGEVLAYSDAISALQSLDENAAIIAFGKYDDALAAWAVESLQAGSSVPWDGNDIIRGVTTNNADGELTLKGVVVKPDERRAKFLTETTLQSGDSTKITDFEGESLTSSFDIPVGSQLHSIGQWQLDNEQSTFDASNGVIRLKANQIVAQVIDSENLTVDLIKTNGTPTSWYNWNDNSTSPDNFSIDLAGLDVTLAAQEYIQARGQFVKNGSADFVAKSITKMDFSSQNAVLNAKSPRGSTTATISDGLFQLSEQSEQTIKLARVPWEITQSFTAASIAGAAEGTYALMLPLQLKALSFTQYDELIAAIAQEQANGAVIRKITATGIYHQSNQHLDATRLVVTVK